MKKFFALVAVVFLSAVFAPSNYAQNEVDIILTLEQLEHPAAMRLYNQASTQNQHENLTALLKEAEKAYYKCSTIDELYLLDVRMDIIGKMIDLTREPITKIEADYKILRRKLSKSIYDQDKNAYDSFQE
jgi:hypothetical protein